MKLLWILNGCGLEGGSVTGAPVRFQAISSRFADRGIDQRVLTTAGGERLIRRLGSKLSLLKLPASLVLRHEPCVPFRLWSYLVTSVASLFWKLPASEVVITVSDYFCDVIPALRLKRRGVKWIAWIHHCETHPSRRPGNRLVNEVTYRIQCWSFCKIARFADAAWINDTLAGDEIESRLLGLGMPREKIRRMWNGLDRSAVGAARSDARGKYDAIMVGVRANKGMYDIVPIWKKVLELRPNTSLLLMGGMAGEKETLQEIARLKLPISVFCPEGGLLTGAEYYSKLMEGKVLFAPSHEEGWGIVVGEAMAAGLPVVAYDLPAYRKIYAGAYVGVPLFDLDTFAQRLVEVLDSPEKSEAWRQRGLAAIGKYDWDTIADTDFSALTAC